MNDIIMGVGDADEVIRQFADSPIDKNPAQSIFAIGIFRKCEAGAQPGTVAVLRFFATKHRWAL